MGESRPQDQMLSSGQKTKIRKIKGKRLAVSIEKNSKQKLSIDRLLRSFWLKER